MGNFTLKKKYKYFVVSDIHGFYDEFISSLNEKGFDSKNPEHYLISLGDAFDRGPKNLEVLKFLNNLERKILIRGNHEDLYQQLIDRKGSPLPNDITNGTIDTFLQIQNLTSDDLSDIIDEKKEFPKLNPEWLKYISNCINYYETKHYIFIHGWIPINKDETYNKNWRKASKDDWDKARWIPGIDMSKKKIFCPEKTIVCGHYHCSAWHMVYEGKEEFEDFSPYISEKVIAIDGCTAKSKQVNVIVLED